MSRISGRGSQKLAPPLSLVKKMMVFFSRPCSRSLSRIWPTPSSTALERGRVGPPQLLVREVREAAQIFLGRLQRHVQGRLGQVEEERPVLVPLDEIHRLLIEHVGQIALPAGDLLVAVDRSVGDLDHILGGRLSAELFGEHDPGVGRMGELLGRLVQIVMPPLQIAVEIVEAAMGGEVLRLIAEVPLAQRGGGVALFAEQVAEGFFMHVDAVGRLARGRIGVNHPLQAVALLVAAGQQSRPGRSADRAAGIGLGEPHAVAGQRVDVRRGDVLRPIDADVAIAHVVDQDHDDVGLCRIRRGGLGRSRQSRQRDRAGCYRQSPQTHESPTLPGCTHVSLLWL